MVLELVGSLDAAPIAGATTLGGGAMLRGTLSWGHFGLTVGLGGESQGTIALAPGDVQLVRAPLDFGLRAQLRRDRLEANMDLGPIVSLLFVRGQGYGENLSGVGIDAGARLAIGGRAWLTPRFAVVLGIEASYYPVPTTLRVDHGGADGVAPSFWTGAVAGIATRL